MMKALKLHLVYEFGFHHLVGGFHYGVVIGTAFHAQRTADLKGLQKLVHLFIFKFTATVCLKSLNLMQITLCCGEGARNQISVLVRTCTMTDNLSIERVNEYVNVVPLVLDLHIGQIAYDETFGFCLLKLSIQDICCSSFVASRLMGLILGYRIGGNHPLLFHDSANSTSGHDKALFLEPDFDLSCTVSFSILVENLHNRFG